MRKYNLKKHTLDESELEKVFNFTIYPEDSKITTNKRIVNIDKGSMGGTHWIFLLLETQSIILLRFVRWPSR